MKSLNFGVEIEFTGCTRQTAARIIAKTLGANGYNPIEDGYKTWGCTDSQGRTWKVSRDNSITAERKYQDDASGEWVARGAEDARKCELVTPILQYGDIETLQEIIRALRKEGHAFTNRSCGIHIHVGAESFKPANLVNIARIWYSKEDLIYKAIQCDTIHRNTNYCEKTEEGFIERIKNNPLTVDAMKRAWYGDSGNHNTHYDTSRYRGLNLHAYFTKGTVEFRCFNSELHAGKVKSYIQFCLAVAAAALRQKKALAKKETVANEKYAFRCWLLRLGLIGDEFATARKHLLANLDGNCAWKGGLEQARAHLQEAA